MGAALAGAMRASAFDATGDQSCSVAPNGDVLIKHITHRNQSCFDLTACIVFDRCTASSLSMKYSFKLSLLPNSVRMASFVSRTFVAHQLLNIISVVQTGASTNITRFVRFFHAGRATRFVHVRKQNWPASRRLVRAVLATL